MMAGRPRRAESLRAAFSRCRGGLAAVFGFSLAINLLMLTISIYMMQVFDRVLTSRSLYTLVYLTLLAVGALALLGFFDVLRSRILVRTGIWLDQRLTQNVFIRGLENALAGMSYRTEALRDLATLRAFLAGTGIMALFDMPWVPVYLAVIYLLHPMLGHVALGGAGLLVLLALLNDAITRRHLNRANAAFARSLRGAEAVYRNADVIEGMAMADGLARRWAEENAASADIQRLASDRSGTINAATKALRMIVQIAVLGTGAYLVLADDLTSGGMIAASIILSRALAPVEQGIAAWRQMVGACEAWQRLSALLGRAPRRPPAIALPQPTGRLSIEKLSYTPPSGTHPVLSNISFNASPGEMLAVIGPSAAGKSTLARLIVGIHAPQAGCVRLDGADVFGWSRSDFGACIGYLPQDVELFQGTVAENIARMARRDDAEVVAAAQLAGIHEMILRLPQGYSTQIGEGGAMLSGGQRQRIGLARALYGKPCLLVLDEPSSNLDGDGELALKSALGAAKARGTTVVVVAHRPSLLAEADRIAVIKNGKLDLYGERSAVLARFRRRHAGAVASSGSRPPAVPQEPRI